MDICTAFGLKKSSLVNNYNFVLLISHIVRTGPKLVRQVSIVRQVWLEDVVGVSFHTPRAI